MDIITLIFALAVVAALLHFGRLLVRERGDFEASARTAHGEFSVKAKQKK